MRVQYPFAFKEAVAIALFAGFLAGSYDAVTALGSAQSEQTARVLVNRTNKGDRLPVASTSTTHLKNSSSTAMSPASSRRPLVGCDPAFSAIADPARARIYRRCAA